MGSDENEYASDSHGAVYATEVLYICDTGGPTTVDVNPMKTT